MRHSKFFALACALLLALGTASCGSDSPSGPRTEHHPGDGSINNGDGSTTNTVGGVDFHTTHRDFSSVPKVTDPRTVSATLQNTYTFAAPISGFRFQGDLLIGWEQASAFDHKLVVQDLVQGNEVSTKVPDTYFSGFDYNGAIMTVEGAEDVNFYRVENGVIGNHFFQIKGFKGSKFLSTAFLDEDRGFVFDSDKVWVFPLANTGNVQAAFSVPSFSSLSFTADENYIYVGVGDFQDSSIRIYDKADYNLIHQIDLPGQRTRGITVDGNYVYVSDDRSGSVNVYNKHTYAASGSFTVNTPGAMELVGDLLYVADKDAKAVQVFRVTFN
jgi:hypothetical protein